MVVYADPEKVLSTTSSGSISWVARFYLVGGEGILPIDFLILTRKVGLLFQNENWKKWKAEKTEKNTIFG